jgi:hypothetical protein
MTQKISPYLKFSIAYCNKKGLFTINEITGKRIYEPEDLWEGILALDEYESKNRKGK